MSEPVIVIGEGWAAVAAAGWLGAKGASVRWISASGSRLLAPLPSLGSSAGVTMWAELAKTFEIETGETHKGSFLREFRHKGFNKPHWVQAPTPADREDVFNETLWEPERCLTGLFEERFENISLMDLEEAVRTRVLALPNVSRIEGVSVVEISWTQDQGVLTLASGEKFGFQRLIYADRLELLKEIKGLPKTLNGTASSFKPAEFERKFKPFGAVQLVFQHEPSVGTEVTEGFMLELTKESGEETQKHAFGGFFAEGRKSLWTALLGAEEVGDNHLIAKRLRRIKHALNKVFVGPEWLGPDKKEFMATAVSETVRLEESTLFGAGSSDELPLCWEGSGVSFISDGFGPSVALRQVATVLEVKPSAETGSESQAENIDATDPSQP